jgi:hypothetical protein
MFTMRSRMSTLNYIMGSEVDYLDSDVNGTAFMRAAATIGGRDAVE